MENLELKKSWSGRTALVTGATGMVGSSLVKDLLAAGARVVALVRDNDPQSELIRSGAIAGVNVVNGAVEDFWTLERAINEYQTDTVFHLAAQPLVGAAQRLPLPTFESNIRGTYNLLEAARQHADLVRAVVVASSDKAYGTQTTLPYVETMPLVGAHPYEVSKSCADLIAQSYHHTYGLPVAIARCGNIYGPGDLNWSRIVPGTIASFIRGERPIIRSDGTNVRDYIYVKDASHAYVRLAEALSDGSIAGEAFNFSDESPRSVLQIVEVLQRLMSCSHLPPDIRRSASGEIHSQYLSAAKARRHLEWKPGFTLDQGLSDTIAWYRAFLTPRSKAEA
ncbi:MAG TPA: NAD-dependent epimerase/dehydratase family protein [Vicinamibacterales bacterium]|nr:NAD-dependent epimerase/dehydratase family protein [Vicinamibacterales bacterium]